MQAYISLFRIREKYILMWYSSKYDDKQKKNRQHNKTKIGKRWWEHQSIAMIKHTSFFNRKKGMPQVKTCNKHWRLGYSEVVAMTTYSQPLTDCWRRNSNQLAFIHVLSHTRLPSCLLLSKITLQREDHNNHDNEP